MPRSIARTLALFLITLLFTGTPLVAVADDAPQPEDLFRTLDANDDGTLSADEIGPSQRQAFERLLRVGDADEDGSLTREEYLKGLQPDPPAGVDPPGRGPVGDGPPRRPDFGRLFEMADRDGDGKIALEDLPEPARDRMQPLFERLGKEQLTREDFERLGRLQRGIPGQPMFDAGRLFERFDEDGDGRISRDDLPEPLRRRFGRVFERLEKDELTREEFQQAMRLQRPGPQPDRQAGESMPPADGGRPLMALVRLLDADGDGQLTTSELESLTMKFTELDTNDDGKLSGAELIGLTGRAPGDGRPPGARPAGETPRPRRPVSSTPGSEK